MNRQGNSFENKKSKWLRVIPGISMLTKTLDALQSEIVSQRHRIKLANDRINNQETLIAALVSGEILRETATISDSRGVMFSDMPRVVVSLTSYPKRIGRASVAVFSLLQQTHKPDAVVLWLAEEQFPGREADLPKEISALKERGLTIAWCRDIKSYKKLIPALEKYGDALIVTADDDLFYPSDWLEKLVSAYRSCPNVIHAHRCHRVMVDKNGALSEYANWHNRESSEPSNASLNFPTTGAGVIYFPGCFHPDILNETLFSKLSPTSDDIWFWTMAVLQATPIHEIQNGCRELISTDTSETFLKTSLYDTNFRMNDVYLKRIVDHYPVLQQILTPENNNATC